MVNRIELPQQPQGDAETQLRAMYSYLYQMAQALNNNLEEIGGAELTDSERTAMQEVLSAGTEEQTGAATESETLKSLIIKTASFIKTAIDQYNLRLTGSTEAEGKIGKYVRNTQMDVDVTPEGIQQSFSFQEIIQGLKTYEINAKNYIKSGLLRTVNGVPVYGVAIGKDIVTFSQDGTETYNDGNKVAELTAEELSFWQNGAKVASYKGTGINFAQDVTIASGKKLIIDTENFKIDSDGKVTVKGDGEFSGNLMAAGGTFSGNLSCEGQQILIQTENLEIDGDGRVKTKSTSNNTEFEAQIGGVRGSVVPEGDGTKFTIQETGRSVDGLYYPDVILAFVDKKTTSGKRYDAAMRFGTGNRFMYDETYSIGPQILLFGRTYSGQAETIDDSTLLLDGSSGTDAWFNKLRARQARITQLNYNSIYQVSSREIKHDIQDMPSMGARLDRLRPVTFVYDEDAEERTRYGLIYEEAAEAMPEICTGSEENKAINYIELIPMLLKEIQELRGRVSELERRLENVQGD